MKLSIITCTYNSEKYLSKTIDGIEKQYLDNNIYEHIFVDGYSNDNTISIIKKYIEKNPSKNITLIQKKSKGVYNAMNEGIKKAQGEYILFCHSDDYLLANTLSSYLNFIEKTGNKDLYYAKFNAIDSNGNFLYNAPFRKIYKNGLKKWIFGLTCYINQSNIIHKKSLHKKFGLFNENNKIISDKEFFIKLANDKIEGIFFDKTISCFRVHDLGTSNNPEFAKIHNKERKYVWNKYYGVEKYIYMIVVNTKIKYKKIKKYIGKLF